AVAGVRALLDLSALAAGDVAGLRRPRGDSRAPAAPLRAREGGRACLPARTRTPGRPLGGQRPRREPGRRGISERASLRRRTRSLRAGLALRAAEHDADRDW